MVYYDRCGESSITNIIEDLVSEPARPDRINAFQTLISQEHSGANYGLKFNHI